MLATVIGDTMGTVISIALCYQSRVVMIHGGIPAALQAIPAFFSVSEDTAAAPGAAATYIYGRFLAQRHGHFS
jgi:hypothetical protein